MDEKDGNVPIKPEPEDYKSDEELPMTIQNMNTELRINETVKSEPVEGIEKSTENYLDKITAEINANNAQIGENFVIDLSEQQPIIIPLPIHYPKRRPARRIVELEPDDEDSNDNEDNLGIHHNIYDDGDFDGAYRCNVCRKLFDDEEDLMVHTKNRTPGKNYGCCACDKVFKDNTQLNVHIRKHTGEKPFECGQCGKKFSINGNLSKHMRTHTGERRFECNTCSRKFMQFAHLEDHLKTHSGERPFNCEQCHSAFKTKARLRKHLKSHEEGSVRKRCVRCPICSKVMKTSKQLYGHMKTHTDEKDPFHCEVCGKNYRSLFYLQSHQKIHDGIRAYKCSLCDKAFVTSSQLRRHENSHAGFKPYSCEECMRPFATYQNLKRHMLTHSGEKPFVCSTCNKGFLTLENKNRHIRTHTGEKPYSCDICGRQFAHSTTVKEHRRIHTGDKPYGCSICDRRFTVNKMLYKHMRQRHPEFYDTFKEVNNIPMNARLQFAHNFDKDEYQQPEYVKSSDILNDGTKKEPEAEDVKKENDGISNIVKYLKLTKTNSTSAKDVFPLKKVGDNVCDIEIAKSEMSDSCGPSEFSDDIKTENTPIKVESFETDS